DVAPDLNISTTPQITAEDAVKASFAAAGVEAPAALSPAPEINGRAAFVNPQAEGFTPITAELTIFPLTASSARLAYRISIEVDAASWYEILIDANTREVLFRHNVYKLANQGRVWTESPAKGERTLVTFPDGWFANTTVTTGNNADAFLDANGNGVPDT